MLTQNAAANGERGVVLNMASVLAVHPEPRHFEAVAYAASKGGVIAMTRTMAAFYADKKIRVNAIAPALVRTPMSARASEDVAILDFIRARQPLTEGLIPVDAVASSCAYLLTPESRAVTGQVISVDGGWSLS
jgi:NAD(P)-dependent dehydrogenase (short-subunit alcohol dehydrogenase family)